MANPTLQLNYNVSKVINITGKNAANTAERSIHNIVYAVVLHPTNFSITVDPSDPQKFTVKNINATFVGNDQINFSAVNEVGNTIIAIVPVAFIPSDPATILEVSYSDPV